MNDTMKSNPDTGTAETKQPGEVMQELRELGQNLRALLQSAWESDERKKMQGEIETGLNDLFASLSQAAKDFSESPTGQTLKSDLQDVQERIRTGEVETKIHSEVVSALRAANECLRGSVSENSPSEKTGE